MSEFATASPLEIVAEKAVFSAFAKDGPVFLNGRSGIDIEEVESALGVRYTRSQLRQLNRVPFCGYQLHALQESHLLIPGYPLSIADLARWFPDLFPDLDVARAWEEGPVDLRWYLVRRDDIRDVQIGVWSHASQVERVLTPAELVYSAVVAWRALGIQLLKRAAWSSSLQAFSSPSSMASITTVGPFDPDVGISFGAEEPDQTLRDIGFVSELLP